MKNTATKEQYMEIWQRECANEYPVIDGLEKRLGFAVDREWLNSTAYVLTCPVKLNPPNWQHGRVIYAVLSEQ